MPIKKYYKLKEIEYNYNYMLENIQDSNKDKIKRLIKKDRKKMYEIQKTYLISSLVSEIIKKLKIKNKSNVKIIIDIDNFNFTFDEWNNYFNNMHPYLKFKKINYELQIVDSKKNFILQGSDFWANAVWRNFERNNNDFFSYFLIENDDENIFEVKHPWNEW
ncbi:hypothetical protein GL982_05600 [Spiroplasma citri]|nr:DUF3800 domain-containing protein [Spiroplasma citri]QIA73128.1 hypothetical protein GL982_05600 [Spiroplasma citri]